MTPAPPSPHTAVTFLDSLHARARSSPLLYRVVLATRCLFAMAFVPTGMVKLLGLRFTQISPDDPIGAFFEAMYQTGGYWQFLGATQVVAGLLMLWPRAATLGAVMFFPVALNIFVITVALGFRGTPMITGAMLFAATALLAWDWDRLRSIITTSDLDPAHASRHLRVNGLGPRWEQAAYAVGTACGLSVFAAVRGFGQAVAISIVIPIGVLAALVAAWGTIRAMVAVRAARRLAADTSTAQVLA